MADRGRSVTCDDSPEEDGSLGLESSRRILVLNRNWQAVNIVGVRRAFSLLWQDHARVINTFGGDLNPMSTEDWLAYSSTVSPLPRASDFVRTIRRVILLPRILLLNHYDRLPIAEVKFNRQNVFERDRYTCQYSGRVCRAKDLTLDHVIPRERGGRTSWENIVTCARDVNERKANRLPHEAGLRLLRKPERPRWRPFVSVAAGSDIDASWTPFLHVEKSAS